RDEDLVRFREDIDEVLLNELVSRYHFQTGRAEAALAHDPCVAKAIEVLTGPLYAGILSGNGTGR
ncbi:MAG: hypothetical protein RBT71_14265, partial [Flavobacteriales bacterium]|nr:hypothetical protein [Flavobacteriales bacterium]